VTSTKAELFDSLLACLLAASKIDGKDITTPHDAMLLLRSAWDDVEKKLKDRNCDSFEHIAGLLETLSATALAMAAALKAKALNQTLLHLEFADECQRRRRR